jgi:hypothetical protein
VTFIYNEMTIFTDLVIHHPFSNQTLNEGNIQHTCRLLLTTADSSDGRVPERGCGTKRSWLQAGNGDRQLPRSSTLLPSFQRDFRFPTDDLENLVRLLFEQHYFRKYTCLAHVSTNLLILGHFACIRTRAHPRCRMLIFLTFVRRYGMFMKNEQHKIMNKN